MDPNNSFGAWLKNFRREHGLTQEALAEKLGFTPEYIRKLESGRRPLTTGVAKSLSPILGLQKNEYEKFIEDSRASYAHPGQQKSEAGEDTETLAPGDPPYKGLSFFDVTDAHLYFGRKAITTELVNLLAEATQGNSRFLAVIGASGSGKSSLVRAGLAPALKKGAIEGSDRWMIKILTPTAHPLKELAVALSEHESDRATLQLMDDLATDERVLDLHLSKVWVNADLSHSRFLLIIDQFEELFTLCKDPVARRAYIGNLLTAAQVDGPTIVLITLRADFYRHCLEYEQLRLLLESHTKTVGALSEEELRETIVAPATAHGWDFEAGLVDLFLDDVGEEPGALPLLSHALRETWEHRRGHTLTLAGYTHIGRVQGAIATTADRVLAGLTVAQKLVAKRIFLRLTELGEGAEDTRRRVRLAELLPSEEERRIVEQVLQILADARLITLHSDEAEVAHEALIREWPLLRVWLADNREGLRIHRRLTESANEWTRAQFDEGILYRGARLEQALAWMQEQPSELNEQERKFLAASQFAVEAAQKAEEEARTREVEHQRLLATAEAKRAKVAEERAKEQEIAAIQLRRRRNFLAITSAIALIFAALTGLFGVQSNRHANQADIQRITAVAAQATATVALATAEVDRANAIMQQSTAEARATVAVVAQATAEGSARLANAERLAAQARMLSASTNPYDHDVALLIASEAVTLTLEREGYILANADRALSEAIEATQRNQWHLVTELPHPAGVSSATYSPDGQRIVSACDDAIVRLWDVKSGKEVRQLTGHTAGISSVSFSTDGQRIISASADGTGRLWDVASGLEIRQLTGHTGTVNAAAFSPNGKQIVSAGEDQTVRLWDTANGTEIRQMTGHTATVNSAVFSPDGQQIVSASADETARSWDVSSGKEVRQLVGHKNIVWSAAFSPDGQQIVSAGEDSTVRVWSGVSGKELHILYGDSFAVRSVAFSPNGQQIVGAVVDLVRIWNVASEKEVRQPISHTVEIRSVAFSPDGQQIISAGADGMVRIWEAMGNQEDHQLIGHTGSVRSATFSPGGERIVSASEDTTIRLWDVKNGQELLQLRGHEDSVRSAMFSPDSQQIVSASEDGTVRIWDVASGKEARKLTGHEGAVWSAVFSPDGKQIASGSQDKTVRIWDVATGEEVRQLTGHMDSIWSVVFSPDGKQIASACADGTVIIWDVASGEEVRRLTGHVASAWSVAFRPDGQQLVSAGDDMTIRIWDLATGQEVRQLLGHTAGVRSAAFSPDGKQIVSASADKTVRFWDVASGQEIRQLVGHTERVLWVTFSPNGQQIASASADTTIRLWTVSIDELLTQAQALIQRDPPVLTTEERQLYGLE